MRGVFAAEPRRRSDSAREAIADGANDVYGSAVAAGSPPKTESVTSNISEVAPLWFWRSHDWRWT